MSDKSPRKGLAKKAEKSLKEKRAEKKTKGSAADPIEAATSRKKR